MVYVRGHRDDYDNWARLGNPGIIFLVSFTKIKNLIHFLNPGWGYDDILPYFKKSMDQQDPQKLFENPEVYSTEGKSL